MIDSTIVRVPDVDELTFKYKCRTYKPTKVSRIPRVPSEIPIRLEYRGSVESETRSRTVGVAIVSTYIAAKIAPVKAHQKYSDRDLNKTVFTYKGRDYRLIERKFG